MSNATKNIDALRSEIYRAQTIGALSDADRRTMAAVVNQAAKALTIAKVEHLTLELYTKLTR